MTRGNQRELARQKQAKKQAALQKAAAAAEKEGNKGMKLEERRLRDAQALKAKQEAKAQASQKAA